jgi:hypothetical protein
MAINWKNWSKNDVIYGIIAPILVVLLIVGLSQISALFGGPSTAGVITGILLRATPLYSSSNIFIHVLYSMPDI